MNAGCLSGDRQETRKGSVSFKRLIHGLRASGLEQGELDRLMGLGLIMPVEAGVFDDQDLDLARQLKTMMARGLRAYIIDRTLQRGLIGFKGLRKSLKEET